LKVLAMLNWKICAGCKSQYLSSKHENCRNCGRFKRPEPREIPNQFEDCADFLGSPSGGDLGDPIDDEDIDQSGVRPAHFSSSESFTDRLSKSNRAYPGKNIITVLCLAVTAFYLAVGTKELWLPQIKKMRSALVPEDHDSTSASPLTDSDVVFHQKMKNVVEELQHVGVVLGDRDAFRRSKDIQNRTDELSFQWRLAEWELTTTEKSRKGVASLQVALRSLRQLNEKLVQGEDLLSRMKARTSSATLNSSDSVRNLENAVADVDESQKIENDIVILHLSTAISVDAAISDIQANR
jgi:hypothetical protein